MLLPRLVFLGFLLSILLLLQVWFFDCRNLFVEGREILRIEGSEGDLYVNSGRFGEVVYRNLSLEE